jgi:hypothetical protein
MPNDNFRFKPTGRVRMRSSIRGLIIEKNNLVVDASVELVAQAMLGADAISKILYGYSGGVAVTPGQRQIYNPVYSAPAGGSSPIPPYISTDSAGLKSIITWTGVFANTTASAVTYDMVGLVSQNDRLFAAFSSGAVPVAPGEAVATEWTIFLRGV